MKMPCKRVVAIIGLSIITCVAIANNLETVIIMALIGGIAALAGSVLKTNSSNS